jgi:hypothetical protein
MRLTANYVCPERRSDDGQTILEGIQTGLKSRPDLVLRVELSGLEPLTSCVPVSLGLSVSAVVYGWAGQGWCWQRRVTPCMPDRLLACLANDLSPVLPAPAWPPSLA